jgi:uncharacterized protein (TIGR02284 family)
LASPSHNLSMIDRLIAVANACVRGYSAAKDRANGNGFAALLNERIIERQAIVTALQNALEARGAKPASTDPNFPSLHLMFEDLSAAIAERNDREVIARIGSIEDAKIAIFEEAINCSAVSLETSGVIRECVFIIKQARDRISDIEYAIADEQP